MAHYRTLSGSADLPDAFKGASARGLAEIHESQSRFTEAAACYLENKDDRREDLESAEDLVRAGLCLARAGEEKQALETWKLLHDVPGSLYGSSEMLDEIRDAILLSSNPEKTLAQWAATREWWKERFTPFFLAMSVGGPGVPPFLITNDFETLNLECRQAVASKDKRAIMLKLASCAITARWLPEYVGVFRELATAYLPTFVNARQGKLYQECLSSLTGIVKVAQPETVTSCVLLHAATELDLGRNLPALETLESLIGEGSTQEAEFKERATWIFSLAATRQGSKLDTAIKYATPLLEKEGVLTPDQWIPVYADLLVKAGRKPDAVAFLKARSTSPAVKGNSKTETLVQEKLNELQREPEAAGDFDSAVSSFLKKHRPVWYDHVGPANLTDPRVGNPATILSGNLDRFHELEGWRLRMLVALSPDLPNGVRHEAFQEAVVASHQWQTTWMEAADVCLTAIEDPGVPLLTRLPIYWECGKLLAKEGQVDALAKLKASKATTRFSVPYQNVHLPLLEKIASTPFRDSAAILKILDEIGTREMDEPSLDLAKICYSRLIAGGDMEAASTAREKLKNWNFSAENVNEKQALRSYWVRWAASAKPCAIMGGKVSELYADTLKARAAKAPADWRGRIDVENMLDLEPAVADAIRAASATSGHRFHPIRYAFDRRFWSTGEDGSVEPGTLIKLLGAMEPFLEESVSAVLLTDLLGSYLAKGGIPAPLKDAATSFAARSGPMCEAEVKCLTHPSMEKNAKIDIPWALEAAKSRGPAGLMTAGGALESLILSKDKAGLRRALASLPEDQLSAPNLAEVYLPALRLLQDEETLEIATEQTVESTRRIVLNAWLQKSPEAFNIACDFALLCDRKDLLPEAWLQSLPNSFGSTYDREIAAARAAEIKGDWKSMHRILSAIPSPRARDEDRFHALRGIAFAGIGDMNAARAEMEAVVKLGQSGNRRFLQASQWLEKHSK